MADQTEDFSSLSLPDRFAHKNWKARKGGYEDAKKQFEISPDESDPAFRPFLQDSALWKGAVADSNVAAQQEGLAAYCAFLQFGGAQACSRSQNNTIGPIIEKGLASTRPAAKNSAREALLLIIEIDRADSVIEGLLGSLSHKQPKVVAAALSALTLIYHSFGCKIVDAKPALKSLPKVFGHADKNVRAEAQGLTVELYRWLKEAAKVLFWSDLKPVQQQDLEKLFENVKQEPPPKQERFTRAQQDAMATATEYGGEGDGGSGGGGGGQAEAEEDEDDGEIDPFDLADPIDILAKLPSGLYESLASSKWKDRKDALDELYKVCNVTKIKEVPLDEVLRALSRCMKDANVAVVTVAANTIQAIATGLRKSFAKYRSTVVAPMMERLKEKKQTVADALGNALSAVFESTSLTDCLEDILEFSKHKNPQVKQETVKFLCRCLRNTRDVPSKSEVKSIAEAATKLLTESSEVTRTGACEVLGVLMKIMGERPMNPYMDGLDDIRKTRIKEFFDTAEVKAKDRPKPIIGPPKAMASVGGGRKLPPGKKPLGIGGAGKKLATPDAASEPPTPAKKVAKGVPKLGGVPKSSGIATPGSAMKMQRKIPGPAGAAASPQRRAASPTSAETVPPPPKFGIGRGLTSRPIGKSNASSNQEPVQQMNPPTGLSAIERAELEELRADKDRLAKLTDDLRTERTKLISEINELQNQNAQLIEDHTRDVLSVKAKETQLVRARSDAEAAEQNVQKQQNQIERLKRELSRALRAGTASSPTSGSIPDLGYGDPSAAGIYQDELNNHSARAAAGRYMDLNSSRFEVGSNSSSSIARHKMLVSPSPSEEKENNMYGSPSLGGERLPNRSKRLSPPVASNYSSGRGSPVRTSRMGMSAGDGASSTSTGEPAENWKRAAEVTSQLKARIEQMKARQGLSRQQHPH